MVYQYNQNMNILGSLTGFSQGGFGLGGCSSFGGGWSGACGSIFNMMGGIFGGGMNMYGGGCGTGNLFYNCKTGNYNYGAMAGFSVGNSLMQVLGMALGHHFTSKRAEKVEARAAEAKAKTAKEALQKQLKAIDEKIDAQQAIIDKVDTLLTTKGEKEDASKTAKKAYEDADARLTALEAKKKTTEGLTTEEEAEYNTLSGEATVEGSVKYLEKAKDKAAAELKAAEKAYETGVDNGVKAKQKIEELREQRVEIQEKIEEDIQAQLDDQYSSLSLADEDYNKMFEVNGKLKDNQNVSAAALTTAYTKFNNAGTDAGSIAEKRKFANQFKAIYNELNNTSAMDITKTLSNAYKNVENWLKRNPK